MSKKAIAIFLVCLVPLASAAENPILGESRNSIKFDAVGFVDTYSSGTRSYFLSYSQPNSFFRLPGRRNLSVGYIGGSTNWYTVQTETYHRSKRNAVDGHKHDLSQMFFGISQDVALYSADKFYTGVGIGPYFKERFCGFVESRFMMGERFFIGYRLGDFNVEFVAHHFSNGHLTEMNQGLNGFGAGVQWNF
jgi:hypothetical protein